MLRGVNSGSSCPFPSAFSLECGRLSGDSVTKPIDTALFAAASAANPMGRHLHTAAAVRRVPAHTLQGADPLTSAYAMRSTPARWPPTPARVRRPAPAPGRNG
jgi:hypothetical protein